jgi:hypothetical protein
MMVRVRVDDVDVILMLNVCLLQNLQSTNWQTMRFKLLLTPRLVGVLSSDPWR